MTPLISRFIVIIFGLFAAAALLVHAQPRDEYDIVRLLVYKDCAAPCFLGIRPGITTAGDAVKLLENHEWVMNIESRYTDFGQSTNTFWGYVYWQWKSGSPFWTHTPTFKLGLYDSYLRILDGRVNEIAFSTSLPLGALVLSFGRDGLYALDRPDRYGSPPYSVMQRFYYPDAGLVFASISHCPALNPDWHQDTVITLWTTDYYESFLQVVHAIAPSLDEARETAHVGCR